MYKSLADDGQGPVRGHFEIIWPRCEFDEDCEAYKVEQNYKAELHRREENERELMEAEDVNVISGRREENERERVDATDINTIGPRKDKTRDANSDREEREQASQEQLAFTSGRKYIPSQGQCKPTGAPTPSIASAYPSQKRMFTEPWHPTTEENNDTESEVSTSSSEHDSDGEELYFQVAADVSTSNAKPVEQ